MKHIYFTSTLVVLGFILVGCAASVETVSPPTPADQLTCPYHVYRHDATGWLLTKPEVHFVYWGQYWLESPTDQDQYIAPWDKLLNGGSVLQRLSQYGIDSGFFDATVYNTNPGLVIPSPTGGNAPDGTLDAGGTTYTILPSQYMPLEINNEIQAGELPVPDSNTFYAVLLPPGFIPTNDLNLSLGGYHGHAFYGGQAYTFAAILYSNWADETMGIMSHELYEAATNPGNGTGWYDDASGQEVADLCQVVNESWWETIDNQNVQKVWSQVACTCQ